MKYVKFFVGLYITTLLGLFLYSFTQIDLSLTFSRIEFLQELVKSFQWVGYFNRPLSTFFYIFLLVSLFNLYLGFLIFAYTKQISKKLVWKLIIITTVILTFSYNAFSYDIFNYIFDAKIITHYQENPYEHKALDYADDPMLSFMRWTHRVYPYGPVWLGLTVPLSYAGFGFFLPTFFLFKSLMAAGFLGSVYFVGKILQRLTPEKEIFGLVFFGLSPLVVIESLVSGHLDIVMYFFALWAFYLLIQKKYFWSFVLLAVSIGIKFVTAFLLPIFLFVMIMSLRADAKQSHISSEKTWGLLRRFIPRNDVMWRNFVFISAIILLAGSVIVASLRTNFQPWYLIAPLTFAVFLSYRYFIFIPSFIISFVAMLTYVPYLYLGNWDPPVPQGLNTMYFVSYIVSFVVIIFYSLYRFKIKDLGLKNKKS